MGTVTTLPKQIYRYALAPTCRNKCGGAFNGFLFCDRTKKACVSRSRNDFIRLRGFNQIQKWYPSFTKGQGV